MTLRIVCAAVSFLLLVGCADSEPSPFERFEDKCERMKGFVVRVEPPGWNDTGRYDCIVDGKKVYVPDATAVLQ